jgi:hypothetical protein
MDERLQPRPGWTKSGCRLNGTSRRFSDFLSAAAGCHPVNSGMQGGILLLKSPLRMRDPLRVTSLRRTAPPFYVPLILFIDKR